ncbi:MAG: hypothetical protein AAB360_02535 [Patescibacteria group bacterium]
MDLRHIYDDAPDTKICEVANGLPQPRQDCFYELIAGRNHTGVTDDNCRNHYNTP